MKILEDLIIGDETTEYLEANRTDCYLRRNGPFGPFLCALKTHRPLEVI